MKKDMRKKEKNKLLFCKDSGGGQIGLFFWTGHGCLRRSAALLICTASLLSAVFVGGCGRKAEGERRYEEPMVADVFDSLANYQGIQSGWFAGLVKERFNMELNIIAPNVAGGGETLLDVRAAAGNIGDIIICDAENGDLGQLVEDGLVLDMEPYLKDGHVMRYEEAIRALNDPLGGGIYAIPSELASSSPDTPMETLNPTYGPYVRWDLYRKLGYPRADTLEELLPILEGMQELEPVSESGDPTYAFSFFPDWDANLMNAAKQPCCFYGYDEFGFVLAKADGSDFQSIIEPDSLYMRVLKWFFEANQMGLVDPESPTQSYSDMRAKFEDGQILFSPWPWVVQPLYNTGENRKAGKGYMMMDIGDMEIYSYGCSPWGNQKTVIAVGSQTRDPKRMAHFIDWLYSPEGIQANGAEEGGKTAGPEGLCWEMGEEGPYLTGLGQQIFLGGGASLPKEWGGGSWKDGISVLNYKPVAACELDENGYPYFYEMWDSVKKLRTSALDQDWMAHMGADSAMDYLKKNQKLTVAAGCEYMSPRETSEQSAIRRQCRKLIQQYSWSMVFAQDEEAFEKLAEELRDEVRVLGYDTLLAMDLENAKAKAEARRQVLSQ